MSLSSTLCLGRPPRAGFGLSRCGSATRSRSGILAESVGLQVNRGRRLAIAIVAIRASYSRAPGFRPLARSAADNSANVLALMNDSAGRSSAFRRPSQTTVEVSRCRAVEVSRSPSSRRPLMHSGPRPRRCRDAVARRPQRGTGEGESAARRAIKSAVGTDRRPRGRSSAPSAPSRVTVTVSPRATRVKTSPP